MTEQNEELLLTDEERREIPKGFHYLLEYKEELDWLLNLQLAKAKPIIEKQFAENIENVNKHIDFLMPLILAPARREAKKQERERIIPNVEEVIRVLAKVVPSDQNAMIDWAVKSKDSVYTNAGTAYRLLLELRQALKGEE